MSTKILTGSVDHFIRVVENSGFGVQEVTLRFTFGLFAKFLISYAVIFQP